MLFNSNILSKTKKQIKSAFSSTSSRYNCVICFNTISSCIIYDQIKVTCGHKVCRDCIRLYFFSVLENIYYEKDCTLVQCSYPNCSNYFDSNQFLSIVFTKEEIDKWWNVALTKSYISNKVKNRLIFFD